MLELDHSLRHLPNAIGRGADTVTEVEVTVNGEACAVEDGTTVEDLLHSRGLAGRWVLVERNGEPVLRSALATTVLTAGDRIELVRAVAGG